MYANYEELIKNMQEAQEGKDYELSLLSKYDDVALDDAYQAYSEMLIRLQTGFSERTDYEHRQRFLRKRQKHMENPLNYCTVIQLKAKESMLSE